MNKATRKLWAKRIELVRSYHIVEGDVFAALEEAIRTLDEIDEHAVGEIKNVADEFGTTKNMCHRLRLEGRGDALMEVMEIIDPENHGGSQ